MIKTRFAPSPTGFLHVGGLRTALFAYLFAKKMGGKFLLRIEDTDRERFVEGGMENILNSLHWAGIKPDEGVDFDASKNIVQTGEVGPYIQSERLEIYKKYIDELTQKDHAYYCFCSKERLSEVRKVQEINKQPTGYDGQCRNLSIEDAKERIKAGESCVVRMKMPKEGATKFTDLVRGEVEFKNELIDDQVILKTDGFPTYHLAVVVDDHLMGITHVIRGEEWISSTPKHIKLYEMFGWEVPQFAHLSLLVNEKKQKLSKRHGDVSVEDFKEKGYLPEALVNFISFLGWNPGDERDIFSLEDLEKEFDMAQVGKAAAVFDRIKLDWYGQQYIMNMDLTDLATKCESFYHNAGIKTEDWNLESVVQLEQGRANTLVEIVENTGFIFAEKLEYESELLVWKKSTKEDAKEKLQLVSEFLNTLEGEWSKEILEEKVLPWIKDQGFGNGDVLWPVRVALSGLKNSPGPFEIAGVLGKEKTLERIKVAVGLV
jgi:nondiscriminating glutamyl-tRNA synthetase